MKTTLQLPLAVTGGILMALPGLDRTGTSRFFDVSYLLGLLLLVVPILKFGFTRPKTALLLLIVSNLSFWLSYALWLMRSRLVGPALTKGIDPFAGPVSFWLLIFLTFAIYEGAVFAFGLAANRERPLAAIGLAAVVIQIALTMKTIYDMVQGV